jgi:hypothetical protein
LDVTVGEAHDQHATADFMPLTGACSLATDTVKPVTPAWTADLEPFSPERL